MKLGRDKNYSLLLLAGGKSSRMGQNKAELLYDGKTFAENLISKGRQLGLEKIYVSGFQGEREDVQVVWDIFPERGPLGGIHACMKQMETPYCLVLPVDVPQIPVEVLEELLEFHEKICEKQGNSSASEAELLKTNAIQQKCKQLPVLLEHGDRKEYLMGIYPVQMVDMIEERIRERSASVHGMLQAWGAQYCRMDIPQWQVENINTQEAYQKLLGIEPFCEIIGTMEGKS